MKRAMSLALIFALIILNMNVTACAEELSISAQAYVLYCVENDTVILQKNGSDRMKPASTTKIMTTLLALEACEKNDPIVEFTDSMIAEGSSMYLKVGDSLHLSDLATGMMMASGNDAANATALTVSKSIEDFSALMNKKAKEIGMENTNFVTASGLDDDNHYSTAVDMAKLMSVALENERFCEITKNTSMAVEFLNPRKQVTYNNHNRLLSLYEYCIGGKTGYTKSAGRCLVSAAQKDGVTLVCVTFNAPSDWNDHISLYNYGFERYSAVKTDDKNKQYNCNVVGGEKDEVALYCEETPSAVLLNEDVDKVSRTVYIPQFVYAPVKAGQCVGMVTYELDNEVITQTPLYACVEILRQQDDSKIKGFFRKLF
ncbi:MAG: D-alanyl-D-alanine carboxypeptidase [Ruminococcus sp.]|nr:D-alanyl-D-alanine carboxypeptidase [Ruminococcus sp.]